MSDPIRVLIVDDEPLAREGLRKLCERDPEIEVVGECADGRAAAAAIEQIEPDLLLLDIQMPNMDGFEVLSTVGPDRMPQVIFVTAYDRFALRAFEVNALDYLLKPFSDRRFFDAIARAKQAIYQAGDSDLRARLLALLEAVGFEEQVVREPAGAGADTRTAIPSFASRIAVKERGRVVLVRTDDIDWIEAADYCAKLHVRERAYVIRESMKSLAARLDPAQFFAVSRSAIVNLDRIREIQSFARGSHIVILNDGTRVTLSRARRQVLERRLGQSL
ncbi:MAG: response regulator transcription factor [Gemmatimonadota bacterium]|nr:MAG: response regulator transcription factor [Gemmatimonadota bacterium]